MPEGTAGISQLFWSMSPVADGANVSVFFVSFDHFVHFVVKHLFNPFVRVGCFLWIVVLYISGQYRLLPCCYDKMAEEKHLKRKGFISCFRFYVFVCSDTELQSIAKASLLSQAPQSWDRMPSCFEILLLSFNVISLQPVKPSLCRSAGLLGPKSLSSWVSNEDFVFVSFYGACLLMLTILMPRCITQ